MKRALQWFAAALVAGAGVLMAMTSYAEAVARVQPVLAARVPFAGARIVGAASFQRFADATTSAQRTAAAQQAKLALEGDPTAVGAVVTLGLAAGMAGHADTSERLFNYSRELSRRDLRTSIWFIESRVARGDVHGALVNYDLALRTSESAPKLLFPILFSAIGDPNIRAELTSVLRRNPPWARPMLFDLGNARPVPAGAGELLAEVLAARVPVPREAVAGVVQGLVDRLAWSDAWRLYAARYRGVAKSASRDPRFAAGSAQPTLFDWTYAQADGLNAFADHAPDGTSMAFEVSPAAEGLLARQLQLLPPGNYRLEVSGFVRPGDAVVPPLVRVACSQIQTPSASLTLTTRASSQTAAFSIDSTCPVQWLEVVARSSDAVEPVTGGLTLVRIVPAVRVVRGPSRR